MMKRKIFLQSGSSRQAALPIISDSTMKIDLGLDMHSHLLCNSILYIFAAIYYAIGRWLQKAILHIYVGKITATLFSPSNVTAFCHVHSFITRRSHETGNVHILYFASSYTCFFILLTSTAQRIWPNYFAWSDTVGRGVSKFRTIKQFIYLYAEILCENIAMNLLLLFSGGWNFGEKFISFFPSQPFDTIDDSWQNSLRIFFASVASSCFAAFLQFIAFSRLSFSAA